MTLLWFAFVATCALTFTVANREKESRIGRLRIIDHGRKSAYFYFIWKMEYTHTYTTKHIYSAHGIGLYSYNVLSITILQYLRVIFRNVKCTKPYNNYDNEK